MGLIRLETTNPNNVLYSEMISFLKERKISPSKVNIIDNIIDNNLREELIKDPIPGFEWYYYTNLNITKSYPESRGWSEVDCLRDILQNALDEGNNIDMYADDEGVHVVDYGNGIPFRAFAFGGLKVNDPCYRGGFGEGLKIAVSTLTMVLYYKVYMITTNTNGVTTAYKIVSVFDPDYNEDNLYLIIGKTSRMVKPHGTHVIISGMPGSVINKIRLVSDDNVLYEFYAPPVVESSYTSVKFDYNYDCEVPYRVLNEPNELYACGLYLTNTKRNGQIGKNSVFGYDLWLTTEYELEPNRKAFKESNSILDSGIRLTKDKILLTLANAPDDVWEKLVRESFKVIATSGTSKLIVNKANLFEITELPFDQSSEAMSKLFNAISEVYGGNLAYLTSMNSLNVDGIMHYAPPGSTIVLFADISWDANAIGSMGIADDFYDYVKDNLEKTEEVMNNRSLKGTLAYEYCKLLTDSIVRASCDVGTSVDDIILHVTLEPADNVEGMSTYNEVAKKPEIWLSFYNDNGEPNPSETIRLIVHELAHVLPYLSSEFKIKYGTYDSLLKHNSMLYEYALQYIAQRLLTSYNGISSGIIASLGMTKKLDVLNPTSLEVRLPLMLSDVVNKKFKYYPTIAVNNLKRLLPASVSNLVLNGDVSSISQFFIFNYNSVVSSPLPPDFSIFELRMYYKYRDSEYHRWVEDSSYNFGYSSILRSYANISKEPDLEYDLLPKEIYNSVEGLINDELSELYEYYNKLKEYLDDGKLKSEMTIKALLFFNPITGTIDVLGMAISDGNGGVVYADYKGNFEEYGEEEW